MLWGACCGFAPLPVTQLTWHRALRGDTEDLALQRLFQAGLMSQGPHTEGGVQGSLVEPMCSQAAELVSKNWEAYEAHMRDVRDYLEAALEVSTSSPYSQSQAAGCGAWSRVGISLWSCRSPHKDRAAWKPSS